MDDLRIEISFDEADLLSSGKCRINYHCTGVNCTLEAIDHQTLKVIPKWVKVSERMPDLYQWVLVTNSPKGTNEPRSINIWRWNGERWERLNDEDEAPTFMDIIHYMSLDEPTWWMPLPKEPKDE